MFENIETRKSGLGQKLGRWAMKCLLLKKPNGKIIFISSFKVKEPGMFVMDILKAEGIKPSSLIIPTGVKLRLE